MNIRSGFAAFAPAMIMGLALAAPSQTPHLPDRQGSKIVSVAKADAWAAGGITVLTQAIAVKETGPKETVARFGEIYAFNPPFLVVRRDQPTLIRFLNLQPDDEHDFALFGSKGEILMYEKLPPLQETAYVFTFHREGVYDFKCLLHQPYMSGQIQVVAK